MLDPKLAQERHIELNYILGRFMTDHLVRANALFDGDLTLAVVLGTIGHHNVQRYFEQVALKSPEDIAGKVASGDHLPHLRHCNAHSVSAATGVPRETVRRKVAKLVKKGWVQVGERGQLSITPDLAGKFAEFDADSLSNFYDCARSFIQAVERPAPTGDAGPPGKRGVGSLT